MANQFPPTRRFDPPSERHLPPTRRFGRDSASVLLITTASTLMLALVMIVLAANRSPLVPDLAQAMLFTA